MDPLLRWRWVRRSSDLGGFLQAAAGCDLVLGNRRATAAGRAHLSPAQNLGNALATTLIALGWGHRYQDLGPLRLIRRQALDRICMRDRGFGWTVEMQARALEEGLRVEERPVAYRPRRGGRSKISGSVGGTLAAGSVILSTLAVLGWERCAKHLDPLRPGLAGLLIPDRGTRLPRLRPLPPARNGLGLLDGHRHDGAGLRPRLAPPPPAGALVSGGGPALADGSAGDGAHR